jgi:PPM family protein phosphatase
MPSKDNTLEINVYARTDVGMVRAGNEDTFLVLNLNTADSWTPVTVDGDPPENLTNFPQGHYGTLLAVSDGMGGALAGEVASRMAVEGVRDRMLQFQAHSSFAPYAFHERLRLAVEQANIHINNESIGNADYAGMGATFTAAGVFNNHLFLAQIGDSRCYLIRGDRIQLLTHDQSLVWQLVEAGHITEEEAETHQYKNVILQALGAQPRVNVVVDRVKLQEGDTILLCSDGLSGRVRAEEMHHTVTSSETLREGCERLIQFANERGGDDNITVILAQFRGSSLSTSDDFDVERLERDPDLPYDIDDSVFVVDPDSTLPLGSPVEGRTSVLGSPKAAAKTTSKLRQGGGKTARIESSDASIVDGHSTDGRETPTTLVGNGNGTVVDSEELDEEIEEEDASAPYDAEPALPPPPPAPMPVAHTPRKASQKRSMGPVIALVTVIVVVGIASAVVYKIQLQKNAAANTPQPLALPPPPPPPAPDPKLELARAADQLAVTWDGLQQRLAKLQPKRRRDASKRLDDTKKELELARAAIDSSPDEAKQLLDKVRLALESFERDFPDPNAPAEPADGRHDL